MIETRIDAPGPQKPRRSRPQGSLLARTWWIGVLVLVLGATVAFFVLRPPGAREQRPLQGYITDLGTLQQEYQRFQGRPLQNREAESQFDNAAAMMLRQEYGNAAAVLEQTAQVAPVPVIFNDLGILYAQLNDHARALNAFREALSRDSSYRPVRDNLERLKSLIADSADPVSHELEPNDSTATANLIAVDKPAEGDISARLGDQDSYRFASPPAPRDILVVEVQNQSSSLIPGVRLYDSNIQPLHTGRADGAAGSSITHTFSPPPNTPVYLQIWGGQDSGGAYMLKVRSMKAFDSFEPNDDVFNPHRLTVGDPVDANIMDDADTDFYSFVAIRTGLMSIDVRNRSTTLTPGISTFGPDRRNNGFGQDLRTPGTDLHHRMEVQLNQTYYVQVWAYGRSTGRYSVVVN